MKKEWSPLAPVIGRTVAYLIAMRAMGQSEVARRANIKQQTLSYILTGRNKSMRHNERVRLARVLRARVADIERPAPPHIASEEVMAEWRASKGDLATLISNLRSLQDAEYVEMPDVDY